MRQRYRVVAVGPVPAADPQIACYPAPCEIYMKRPSLLPVLRSLLSDFLLFVYLLSALWSLTFLLPCSGSVLARQYAAQWGLGGGCRDVIGRAQYLRILFANAQGRTMTL